MAMTSNIFMYFAKVGSSTGTGTIFFYGNGSGAGWKCRMTAHGEHYCEMPSTMSQIITFTTRSSEAHIYLGIMDSSGFCAIYILFKKKNQYKSPFLMCHSYLSNTIRSDILSGPFQCLRVASSIHSESQADRNLYIFLIKTNFFHSSRIMSVKSL